METPMDAPVLQAIKLQATEYGLQLRWLYDENKLDDFVRVMRAWQHFKLVAFDFSPVENYWLIDGVLLLGFAAGYNGALR